VGLGDLRDKLPPIKRSTDCCGYITDDVAQLTGLCAGTPVSGGVFDISASSVASGINTLDKLAIITGTWSINEYVTDHPVIDRDLFMTSIYPIEGKWLITEASPTSASNLEWFINNFMEGDRTAAARRDRQSTICAMIWSPRQRPPRATCCSSRLSSAPTPSRTPPPGLSA
jgi:L-xylulokinase